MNALQNDIPLKTTNTTCCDYFFTLFGDLSNKLAKLHHLATPFTRSIEAKCDAIIKLNNLPIKDSWLQNVLKRTSLYKR